MNYQEFKDFVAENIKDYLPEKYQDAEIQVREISKNNNMKLDGLTATLPEQNMCPNIYLNSFYQEYEAGKPMEDIMETIGALREINDVEKNISVKDMLDFEQVKDSIVFRVVGAEENQSRLQNMPHRIEHDMALIYQIMMQKTEDGMASIQITNDTMGTLGVDEKTLHEAAMKNTPREFPMSFRTMNEVIKEIMRKDFMGFDLDELSDEDGMKSFLEAIFEEGMEDMGQNAPPMYVLTNESLFNGAAALFYPEVQEKIAEQLGGDYFVLPSSVHEVLIVPDQGILEYQELKNMVNDVNNTQVPPDEVLTGEVYSYDKESRQLMFASEKEERSQTVEKTDEKKPSIIDTLKAKKEEARQSVSTSKVKATEMEI